MDFKAAGTTNGLTAIQMDLKIGGISDELIKKALEQSRTARLQILDIMNGIIARPKDAISQYAPKIVTIKINPEKIGELIGPGGKNIKKITAETGATIDIEDDGTVRIGAADTATSDRAVEAVKRITEDVEIGKIYPGKVKRIMDFGAFCEVLPGKEGLVHVSELADRFVKRVEDEVKIGDEFPVKVIEIDSQGRINLSRKQAVEGYVPQEGDKPQHDRPRYPKRPHGRYDEDKGKH
jgi:polyribonucleotide nucleotidyltransferase